MLLANISVATKIQESFPKIAVLRCHEAPKTQLLLRMVQILRRFGIHIDCTDSKTVQDSLNVYRPRGPNDHQNIGRWQVLMSLLTSPMKNAEYFCTGMKKNIEDFRHYALSVPLYTHFTSPIRRYPDVLVHR